MATYYLAPTGSDTTGNGSSGNPWKTAEKAYDMMAAGDTCIFKNGTYLMHQGQGIANRLSIRKANTTWKAETTGSVILRGNWGPWLLTETKPPNPPDCKGNFAGMRLFMPSFRNYFLDGGFLIGVSAAGTRIEGLTIECVAGEPIMFGPGSDNSTIKDNNFYWTLTQAIVCYPGGNAAPEAQFPSGIVIDGNRTVFTSTSRFDITYMCMNDQVAAGNAKDSASGAMRIGNVKGVHVKNNRVEYSFGEGIDIGRRAIGTAAAPCIVENNTVHDCRHTQIYVTHGRYIHVRNNISYAISGARFWTDLPVDSLSMAYNVSDESLHEFPNSSHVYFYNNVAVNEHKLIAMGPPVVRQKKSPDYGKMIPREGMYAGFNTFVAGPDTKGVALNFNNDVDSGIIENNLILYEDAPPGVDKMATGGGSMVIRRNAWTEEPPRNFRVAGNVVAPSTGMQLGNPRNVLKNTGFDYYDSLAQYKAGYRNTFNISDYGIHKDGSTLENGATTRTAQGSFWPPIEPFQRDRFGNNRSSPGDFGAREWTGENTAVGIISHIGTGGASGPAPLTVTFTDDSETEGAASVNSWLWNFGDGTTSTAAGPHTKIYGASGVYTVTLTARDTTRNLSSIATQTVTVTESPAVGQVMDAVRVALPTTTGNFTISFALGGATPDMVLLFLTGATTTATKTDNALFCVGAVGAAGQWLAATFSGDDLATTATKRYYATDGCLASLNSAGVTGKAAKGDLKPNSLTLNITDAFPAGYLVVAVAISDPAHQVAIGDFDAATATALALGFMPDFVASASTFQPSVGVVGNSAHLAMAFLGDKSKIAKRLAGIDLGHTSRHNVADSDVKTSLGKGEISNVNTGKRLGIVAQGGGLAFDRSAASEMVGRVAYAALSLNGKSQAVVYGKSPTSTGTSSYSTSVVISSGPDGEVTEGIEPGMLFILGVPFDADLQGWEYDAWTLAIVDSGATFAMLYGDKDNAAASDTWTRAENSLVIRDGAGNVKAAGTVALTATGFNINWTTVGATNYSFYAVAMRKAAVIAGPQAGFYFTLVGGLNVYFADTSFSNGQQLTWSWDFGDGNRSGEQNPLHLYDEGGTYSVTLLVTNAAGQSFITKSVTVQAPAPTEITYIGPFDPMSVTNNTVNLRHTDPGDPDFMRVETMLDLDALVFDAAAADTTSNRSGKVRIVADLANNRLKVIYPNGTVKYITLGNS